MSLLDRIAKGNLPQGNDQDGTDDLKTRIQTKLEEEFETLIQNPTPELRTRIEERFNTLLSEANVTLNRAERTHLFESILSSMLGWGPLEALLVDDTISDIVINGPYNVYVRYHGKDERERSAVTFKSMEHLQQIINRVIPWRTIDWDKPLAHERYINIGYVTVIVQPAASIGPIVVIRKFRHKSIAAEDLIRLGTLTADELHYLQACVHAKRNILISGGESAGKTTLLNILCASIGNDELIVTVEEPEALQLRQEMVISLVAHPSYVTHDLTMNNLIIHALYMRPERLVVDELHPGQTTAITQADYTHWLATVHAATVEAVTPQIAPAADILVHMRYMPDGTHRAENIFRVQGVKEGIFVLADWRSV